MQDHRHPMEKSLRYLNPNEGTGARYEGEGVLGPIASNSVGRGKTACKEEESSSTTTKGESCICRKTEARNARQSEGWTNVKRNKDSESQQTSRG